MSGRIVKVSGIMLETPQDGLKSEKELSDIFQPESKNKDRKRRKRIAKVGRQRAQSKLQVPRNKR